MPWNFISESARRETQLELLRALPREIPGVAEASDSAAAGVSLSALLPGIHDAWRNYQRQVEAQAWELDTLRRQAAELQQEVARWRSRPEEQMLWGLRQQAQNLTQRVEKAEKELVWMREQHAYELSAHDQEITRLQALIAEQNRLIARLHSGLHSQADDVHKT